MRTFDEISADIARAYEINDVEALRRLAAEMQELGTPKADAAACMALGTVASRTGDYSAALDRYRHALALYEEHDDIVGVAATIIWVGNVYMAIGDHPAALEYFSRALGVHKEMGDRYGVASATANMGTAYHSSGNYSLALEHYRQAAAFYKEIDNHAGVANVTGNIGVVFYDTGDYPAALEHFRQALASSEAIGDRYEVAIITGNLGNVYGVTGDYPAALDCFLRALKLHEELGDRSGAATVTNNIGSVHEATGDHATALEYFHQALTLHQELGARHGVALATSNIIASLMKLGRYDEAAVLIERHEALIIDEPVLQARHYACSAMLAEHNGDLDAARLLYMKALELTTESGLRAQSAEHHEKLRDLAQKRNDFAAYIEHNNEYQRITEEIRGKEATQKLTMMEAERKMEGERREREKERALLYGALPKEIADRMVRGENVNGDHFEQAAVLFLDVVNFTTNSSSMHPAEVVSLLESVFRVFDDLCLQHNVMKVKTIGDSYMCFAHEGNGEWEMGNSNEQRTASPAQRVAAVALAMQQAEFYWPRKDSPQGSHEDLFERLSFRIGIHSGPVTAGVIGTQRLQYDVWGDTVNVASRMESTGEPGRIHVSEAFALALSTSPPSPLSSLRGGTDAAPLELERGGERSERGEVSTECPWHLALRGATELKGKGTMTTYWLE